jgi:single-stranded-DNA-specific exonuclease
MSSAKAIFEHILKARSIDDKIEFLSPSYEKFRHDPFLLPDMRPAVDRIKKAITRNEQVYIYGDYDIDGLTATTLLLEALRAFGLRVEAFIPNRFVDGYGLSKRAIDEVIDAGAQLIITVDCGSLSHKEVTHANERNVDIIVTDHHNVANTSPPAIATINPKRRDHAYPFIDLAGVGVAFKLVQALQTECEGLARGQEKWLLDLVAMGTVCDIVTLKDENRANVFWGLKVLQKTRRPGLKALMAVAGVEPQTISSRTLGFVLGPRLNAAGRMETAKLALDLFTTNDPEEALRLAYILQQLNQDRRTDQDRIFEEALVQAESYKDLPVLVVSDPGWSHGIIGIVAAKLLEKYKKPAYVLQEMSDGTAKGSARSYGDFSAADAIRASETHIIKGGGHTFAAGVTLETSKIAAFRKSVNDFYDSLQLKDQPALLHPSADITLHDFEGIDEELYDLLQTIEPYGNGNAAPVFCFQRVRVDDRREMGSEKQHLKLRLADNKRGYLSVLAFFKTREISVKPDDIVDIWVELTINEWQGRRTIEGKLLRIAS